MIKIKIYRNPEDGEIVVETKGGGLANTISGITTYDTDIIGKILGEWTEEEHTTTIFDFLPKLQTLDGEYINDTIKIY
jgi:hypothetical protein